jgi:hypothetical protein
MTDELTKIFSDFARDVISPATFEHDLLTLCKTTPECAWEALALLDQHYRRGRIASELQYSLRHRIQRQALGIESYQIESHQPQRALLPTAAVAAPVPVAPDADDEEPTIEVISVVAPVPPPALAPEHVPTRAVPASVRWRPPFRVSRAIALIAVMLAIVASPTVREGQEHRLAIGSGTASAGEALTSSGDSGAAGAGSHDQGPAMLSLSSDRYIVDPDRDVAELVVERSPDVAGDTSFLWWTEGSGAKPNQDYVAGKPRRVQLAGGVGSSTLRIPILANPNRRHVEMFYVLIGRPEGDTAIGPIHRAAVFLLPRHER